MVAKAAKNTKWYINIIIMFLIYFIVSMIPPVGGITEMGMKVVALTLALLWGWITVDLLWPSVFGFILLQFTGYTTITEGLAAGIGNSTVMMTIILLAFAVSLSLMGVSDIIAAWVISRKMFIGHPVILVFGLLFGTIIISAAGGGMAVIFLIWDLIRAIAKANGIDDNDTLKGSIMAMVLYCGFVGFILPWQNTVWLAGGFWQPASGGLAIPTMEVFYCGIIWAILSVIFFVLVFKFIYRMDFSKFLITEEIAKEFSGKIHATKYQKVGLIGVVIYIGLLLFGNIFKNLAISQFINGLGVVGLSIIYMTIFAIWKKEDGKPVLSVAKAFEATPWAVIMLLAITIPLGDALQSEDTGVMAAIAGWIYPLVQNMSATTFIIICTIFLTVLTQVTHNVICAAVFYPMFTPIVIQLGGDPYVFFFMAFIGLFSAYATPAASMFAGLVFGTKDISTKAGYLAGWTYTITTIIILVVLMPVWTVILPAY